MTQKTTTCNRKCSCFLIYSLRLNFMDTVNNYFLTVIKARDRVMNQTWSPSSRSPSDICTQSDAGPLVVMNLLAALATPAHGICLCLTYRASGSQRSAHHTGFKLVPIKAIILSTIKVIF